MRQLGRGIAVLLILLVLYAFSYLVLLNPLKFEEVQHLTRSNGARIVFFHGFGFSQDFLQVAYKPLILLDQKIRPEYWSWTAEVPIRKSSNP
jgi:hypothetical protein